MRTKRSSACMQLALFALLAIMGTAKARKLRPNRNFWVGLGALERNEELGIDARMELGGGFGRYLKQTSVSELSAVGAWS